jgi:mannose-6-phosphate isomerase-like protein (cupin superfamily)
MARAGDLIEDPVTKQRIRFVKTRADTGGELLQLDFEMFPGGFVPTLHIHPGQEERFIVHSGAPRFTVAGKESDAGPGQTVSVPPGVPHVFRNPTEDDVRIIIEFRPALRTEEMFEVLYALGRNGKLTRNGLPRNPIVAAMFAREFSNETRAASSVLRIATALAAPVAPLGRLFGLELPR